MALSWTTGWCSIHDWAPSSLLGIRSRVSLSDGKTYGRWTWAVTELPWSSESTLWSVSLSWVIIWISEPSFWACDFHTVSFRWHRWATSLLERCIRLRTSWRVVSPYLSGLPVLWSGKESILFGCTMSLRTKQSTLDDFWLVSCFFGNMFVITSIEKRNTKRLRSQVQWK